jgi:hypothetical protein
VFTVSGLLDSEGGSVTWVGPDQLEGDPEVIVLARAAVAARVMAHATPTSSGRPATLVDPLVGMLTLGEAFGGSGAVGAGVKVEGDVPDLPPEERSKPGWIY